MIGVPSRARGAIGRLPFGAGHGRFTNRYARQCEAWFHSIALRDDITVMPELI